MVSDDVILLIVEKLDTIDDIETFLEVFQMKSASKRDKIFAKLFKRDFPYNTICEIPPQHKQNYEHIYRYLMSEIDAIEKVHRNLPKYHSQLIRRRPNKSLLIPLTNNDKESWFQRELTRLARSELGYDTDHEVTEKEVDLFYQNAIHNDNHITHRCYSCNNYSKKLPQLKKDRQYYRNQIGKLMVKCEVVPLIPQVGDCIVDLDELGYREHGKFWCIATSEDSFSMVTCDGQTYSDYGTIPLDFAFPRFDYSYFSDIMDYNQYMPLDTNHPEIKEQLETQKHQNIVRLKTIYPSNYIEIENYFAGTRVDGCANCSTMNYYNNKGPCFGIC